MKRVAILYSEYSPTVDAVKYRLQDVEVECFQKFDGDFNDFDLIVLINCQDEYKNKALKCHHSLLPAFDSDEPVKEALLSGVKVTGITIYETDTKKIIAQYPVFVGEDIRYDELEQELNYLEQVIYPLIVEKVLNNEQFDMKTLLGKNCSGNCGGCNSCIH